MFWVICNACFFRPGQGTKRNFFITSCSHIFCDHCLRPEDSACKRCQANCNIVMCNSQMPDVVKEVFLDHGDKPGTLIKAAEFQEMHRTRLMMHYKMVEQSYQSAKKVIKDLQSKISILEKKCQSYKMEIQNKEETLNIMNRKLNWYKQKLNSSTAPFKTDSQSQMRGSHFDFQVTPCKEMPGTHFTSPKASFTNYRRTNPSCTPDSVMSKRSSFASSGTSAQFFRFNERQVGNGYTPPSNTLALLTLMNKARGSN